MRSFCIFKGHRLIFDPTHMAEKALTSYSYQEYLDLEASSSTKYEYHGGFITAMAGGTLDHGLKSYLSNKYLRQHPSRIGKTPYIYSHDMTHGSVQVSQRSFFCKGQVLTGFQAATCATS